MSTGWIKLHRQIQHDKLWLSEPFTKSQAWVDLLLSANHRAAFITVRGCMIEVARGQIGLSELTMGDRWQWSRGKVNRFLHFLVKLERISIQRKGQYKNIITICNYSNYQDDDTTNDTANDTTNDTTNRPRTGHERYSNNNEKNEKNEKKYKWQNHSLPDWMPKNAWHEWMQCRIKLKAINSERALNGIIKNLNVCIENGYEAEQTIDIAIQRGWKSISFDWLSNAGIKKENKRESLERWDVHGNLVVNSSGKRIENDSNLI